MRRMITVSILGALALMLLTAQCVVAGDIKIVKVDAAEINAIFHIDIDATFDFSEEVVEAINSGVPVTLEIDTEVQRMRRYWWNETIARNKQAFVLTRHALTEQYVITNQVTGDRHAFLSFNDAVNSLSQSQGLPVIARSLLEEDERYRGEVRIRLDIESLPAPMRPLAYLSPAWRMASSWRSWRFEL